MKINNLKNLLKHIILEITKNEMIVNKNEKPDVFGAVNVEEDVKKYRVVMKRSPMHPAFTQYIVKSSDGRTIFSSYDKKESEEKANVFNKKEKEFPTETSEQSTTSNVGSISVPSFGRKKKIKEKTLPDGKYADDMEDHIRSNRVSGLKEMTSSSAAGGQEGGTIKVPAWGTKNKDGSPAAIKATKKMKGWKVVKSITDEGK